MIIDDQLNVLLDKCLDTSVENDIYRWIVCRATSTILQRQDSLFEKFVNVGRVIHEPFLSEIKEDHWYINQNRQKIISVQKETQSISLRCAKNIPGLKRNDCNHDVIDDHLAVQYPNTMSFLNRFSQTVGLGTLQRAMIVKLLPQSQVYSHIDDGLYYLFRDRYHIVLKSTGSLMQVHNDQSLWNNGEVWWLQNKFCHQAFNNSDEDRIHIIFDVLPNKNYQLVKKVRKMMYTNDLVDENLINIF